MGRRCNKEVGKGKQIPVRPLPVVASRRLFCLSPRQQPSSDFTASRPTKRTGKKDTEFWVTPVFGWVVPCMKGQPDVHTRCERRLLLNRSKIKDHSRESFMRTLGMRTNVGDDYHKMFQLKYDGLYRAAVAHRWFLFLNLSRRALSPWRL